MGYIITGALKKSNANTGHSLLLGRLWECPARRLDENNAESVVWERKTATLPCYFLWGLLQSKEKG